MKYAFGAIPSPPDARDFTMPIAKARGARPPRFRLHQTPIKNQHSVGACVAFAITRAWEQERAGEHGKPHKRLAEGFMYGNRYTAPSFHTQPGSIPREVMSQFQKVGCPFYDEYPVYMEKPAMVYQVDADIIASPSLLDKAAKNKLGRFYRLGIDYNAIADAIWETQTAVTFTWAISGSPYNPIALDANGFLKPNAGEAWTYHQMEFDGYDDEAGFLWTPNSWGVEWGHGGVCKLRYDDVRRKDSRDGLVEAWAMDSEPPQNTLKMEIGSRTYYVNGERKEMDVACYLDAQDRTMVPLRFVSEAFGCEVDYYLAYAGIPRKLYLPQSWVKAYDRRHGHVVTFRLGSHQYTRGDMAGGNPEGFMMDTIPHFDEAAGRVFVPVRFLVNALQGLVEWVPEQPKDIVIKF